MQTFNDIATLILNLLPSNQQISAANHRTVETAILTFAKEQWLTGDIKMIDCNNTYINENFETSGPNIGRGIIGKEREGWAICNGYNNTRNRTGRVPVAWGTTGLDENNVDISRPNMTYGSPEIPFTFGEKVHSLSVPEMPRHNHTHAGYLLTANGGGNLPWYNWGNSAKAVNTPIGATGGAGSYDYGNPTSGGTVAHNNMQPSMVTLFIQKL